MQAAKTDCLTVCLQTLENEKLWFNLSWIFPGSKLGWGPDLPRFSFDALGVGLEQNAGASFGPNVSKQYISTYIQSLDSILSGHCITSKHEFSWMKFIKGHRGSECICWFFCRVFELLTMLVCVYFLILRTILSAP